SRGRSGSESPHNDREIGRSRPSGPTGTRPKVPPALGWGAPVWGMGGGRGACRAVSDLPQGSATPRHRARPRHHHVEVRFPMSTSPLPLHGGSTVPTVATPAAPPVGADMGFGPAFAQPETGVDWRRVLSAVARFKWLIAVVTILGTVGGLAATRFIKPQYMVQATLWIDQPDQRGGQDRGPIRAGQPLEPQAGLDLLKSYRVLDQVVRDQHLFVTPKAREDAPLFETFRVAEQYRPGVYRLALGGRGGAYTVATDTGARGG